MAASCLYILYKMTLEVTGWLGNHYFIYWLPKHPVFLFTLTRSLSSTCVTYGTLCYAIGDQVLPTLTHIREAENFPRGCIF